MVTTLYNATATDSSAYSIVTKAETVQGTLTGYNGVKSVTIDGTAYDIFNDNIAANKSVDPDFVGSFANQINETVKAYMVGGIVYAAEMVTEATQYAVVEDSDGAIDSTFSPLKAKIMKADGSEATVEIHKDSIAAADSTTELVTGAIIKYSDVSDGKIKVTEIAAPAQTTQAEADFYDKDTKTFNDTVVSADAVLFVNKTTDSSKVGDFYQYTARNLNSINLESGAYYASLADDGKIVAAYVTLAAKPNGASSDTVYGIVSSENGTVKNGDDTYTSYTVQVDDNRANDKTVLIAGDADTTLKEGYLVSFDVTSDNVYATTDITIYLKNTGNNIDTTKAIAVGVKEYDEAGQIITYWTSQSEIGNDNGTSKKTVAVDDDVQIVFVNSEDDVASEATGAYDYDGVTKNKNAVVVFESGNTNKIVAIFFDVDRNIAQ